jgi:hypothetical protein
MSSPGGARRRAAISSRISASAWSRARAKRRHGPEVALQAADQHRGHPHRGHRRQQRGLEGGDAHRLLHAEHRLDDDIEREALGRVLHDERRADPPGSGPLQRAVADDAGVGPHAGAVQRR